MNEDIRNESDALRELGVSGDEIGSAARGPAIEIPERVDAAIRAAARERAREIREGRTKILRLPVWIGSAAAAAVVMIAVGLWAAGTGSVRRETAERRVAVSKAKDASLTEASPGPQPVVPHDAPADARVNTPVAEPAAQPFAEVVARVARAGPMDIDGSGTVDIVDAFLMSRRLREVAGGETPADWDFDRDGEVGRGDVEAVAIAAVSL
jgi:hypothetical protein